MQKNNFEKESNPTTLPISPSLEPSLQQIHIQKHPPVVDLRVVFIGMMSIALGIASTFLAKALVVLIGFITNLCFYGKISGQLSSPANNHLGYWVILIPVFGSVVVGFMARYGSAAIRGHGIPEAMEQVLTNKSKIPARLTFLKPISSAIAIGTGGPFGAEGPIIATGGALGSLVGQVVKVTNAERKTLLASGAAAGMTAIFGSPLSAVLLAIELLLFEFKPRSFIPVALASISAMGIRAIIFGTAPMFYMESLAVASPATLVAYMVEGVVIGVFAVLISRAVYFVEDSFEHLSIHWMWWPAIGGVFVGVIGFVSPETLGVGYDKIDQILSGKFIGLTLFVFCLFKFLSWSIALGSGTSGGTLAPIFTIGGSLGVLIGQAMNFLVPKFEVDLQTFALVGMASCFAGASRALFASIVFAFETTQQFNGLLPLIAGCTTAYLVSALLMSNSIMTEKLSRRGHYVPQEYSAKHS